MGLWKRASERDLIVSVADLWGLGVGVFFTFSVFGSLSIRCCLA